MKTDVNIRISRTTYKKMKVSAAKRSMTLKDYVDYLENSF